MHFKNCNGLLNLPVNRGNAAVTCGGHESLLSSFSTHPHRSCQLLCSDMRLKKMSMQLLRIHNVVNYNVNVGGTRASGGLIFFSIKVITVFSVGEDRGSTRTLWAKWTISFQLVKTCHHSIWCTPKMKLNLVYFL